MKLYKSFLALSLAAMTMVGCSTEDLENDINGLKEQIADMELQVQRINDNMNIVRVALEGNKTIQSVTPKEDGSYELKLSNDEVISLTQGVDGTVYPSISIDNEGYWVINGEKQNVKAVAKDGTDGVTPKFRLVKEEGTKLYWQVSYDNGKTYEYVLSDGQKVQANAEDEIGVATGGGPIQNVQVGNGLLTFDCGGKSYSLAIVDDLKCVVTAPEDSKENGFWVIPRSGTGFATYDIMGDYQLLDATNGWSAEYIREENKIKVTAPAEGGVEGSIVLQVNKGTSWVVEKLLVKSGFNSQMDKYDNGQDILVGNVKVNKVTFGEATLLNGDAAKIEGPGVYFVDESVTQIDWNGYGSKNMVVIANGLKAGKRVKLLFPAAKVFLGVDPEVTTAAEGDANAGIVFQGIEIDPERLIASDKYLFGLGAQPIENFVLDNCSVLLPKDKNFTYLSNATGGISNIFITNSKIGLVASDVPDKTAKALNLINCNIGTFGNVQWLNNVIYCNTPDKASLVCATLVGPKASGFKAIKFENNTLMNILGNHGGTASGIIRVALSEGSFVRNNLFWYDAERKGKPNNGLENVSHLMSEADFYDEAILGNNLVYSLNENTALTWMRFRTAPKIQGFKNEVERETVNPFATVSRETGEFTYTSEFAAKKVGAQLK